MEAQGIVVLAEPFTMVTRECPEFKLLLFEMNGLVEPFSSLFSPKFLSYFQMKKVVIVVSVKVTWILLDKFTNISPEFKNNL